MLSAAASNLGNQSNLTTRSSQRLMLLKESPRKALSSVSNILLDPGSHEAQQIVRKNNHPVGSSRSSSAILQPSIREAHGGKVNSSKDAVRILGTCKRGVELSNNHFLRSKLSPSDIRHQLFTEVCKSITFSIILR